MKHACVIGWPITHSRSPLIHNHWLQKHDIEGSYSKVAVEPAALQEFLINLSANGYVGCNVTLPHKESAIAYINCIDQSVRDIGALNTVYMRDQKTHATSTDGEGFVENLKSHHPDFSLQNKNIIILGAGGSAKAIIERLLREHIAAIYIANRTVARAQELSDSFGEKIRVLDEHDLPSAMRQCDLLINTTSQGMSGQPPLHIDLTPLPPRAIVADIVYVPLKTELLQAAEARGLGIVPGLGMLLHQAVRGFELWFGVRPQVTPELYTLVARDIEPDYQP
jgi:shikimate dehydrogenase